MGKTKSGRGVTLQLQNRWYMLVHPVYRTVNGIYASLLAQMVAQAMGSMDVGAEGLKVNLGNSEVLILIFLVF